MIVKVLERQITTKKILIILDRIPNLIPNLRRKDELKFIPEMSKSLLNDSFLSPPQVPDVWYDFTGSGNE